MLNIIRLIGVGLFTAGVLNTAWASGPTCAKLEIPGGTATQQKTVEACSKACDTAATSAMILTANNTKKDGAGGIFENFGRGREIMNQNVAAINNAHTTCSKAAGGGAKSQGKISNPGSQLNGVSTAGGEVAEPAKYANCRADDPQDEGQMNAQKACDQYVSKVLTAMVNDAAAASNIAREYKSAMNTVMMVGAGAAAVGGYVVYDKNKKEDEKDKKEKKKAAADYAEGVVTLPDGSRVSCFTSENHMKLECRETLFRLCQGDKASKSGCTTFNTSYCQGEGANGAYCLKKEADAYCALTGANVNSSPGCKWAAARPASCSTDPENVACLYSDTTDALQLACANFPNDPLCKAQASGRVVTVGGTESSTIVAAGSTTTASDLFASSASSSSTSSGGNTTTSSDLLAPSTSLWVSSSSHVQQACASGSLVGCQ